MNKTIGDRLKEKRLTLGLSIEKVSSELKIRPEFIKALERNDFTVFASDIYAKGFIKNYSKYLELDSENFTAVYRRDIQGKKLNVNKSPQINNAEPIKKTLFLTRQKFKYIMLIFFIIFSALGILTILNKTFEPPYLEMISPVSLNAGTITSIDYYDKTIRLTGKTSSSTVIKINGIAISTKTDNSFESELYAVTQDSSRFVIEAINNVNVISRIDLTLIRKSNVIEENSGITGAIQITKDNALIKLIVDDKEVANGIYFENDSIPVIGNNNVTIEADKTDNIKIVLNGEEFKIVSKSLKLVLVDNKLKEN